MLLFLACDFASRTGSVALKGSPMRRTGSKEKARAPAEHHGSGRSGDQAIRESGSFRVQVHFCRADRTDAPMANDCEFTRFQLATWRRHRLDAGHTKVLAAKVGPSTAKDHLNNTP